MSGRPDSDVADPAAPPGGSPLDRAAGKVGGQRNLAILAAGAVVGVLGVANFFRKKKTSAATAGATPVQPASTGASTGFDSGPYDMWNSWESQYETLQNQVNDLRGQIPVPTTPSNPSPAPAPIPVPVQAPPPPPPAPTPAPPPPQPQAQPPGTQWYTAHSGDTYSGIASRYGRSWQELWNFQFSDAAGRPQSTQDTLRRRGPDHALFNGSSVAIPGDWRAG
jgi:type II secretory pathway pseudopilin PulG